MYQKPTIGGTLGLALGIAGLALAFSDYKSNTLFIVLLAIGGAVLVGAALWAACLWAADRAEAEVRAWVREEVNKLPASAGRDLTVYPPELSTHDDDRTLLAAINGILEELEYIDGRIKADSTSYWQKYVLPTAKWEKHGTLLAERSSDAHRAARAAYREVDRITHCLAEQEPLQTDVDTWESLPTVAECGADAWAEAFANAGLELNKLCRALEN